LSILNARARAALGLLLLLFAAAAWAQVAVPELTRRVTDLTATLSAGQTASLENELAAFEARKGSQIAVLILPTTRPEDIAQFGIRVADQWKIGRKKIDDGVILIVAKNDRQLRIEVGYGLEGAIPDAIAKRVIAETITPYFKAGDYYGGIEAGVQQLMKLIDGEPLPPPSTSGNGAGGGVGEGPFVILIVGGLVAGWLLSLLMNRPAAGGIAALGSGAVGAMLLGFTPVLLFIAIFVFAGVASGFRGGGGWSSGGGGGFGGGGSWGGGGGGFGGGGASGSW
jgi:uncharacterized protein